MSNELELNKDRADAGRYYKLFAGKVGKFEDGERILFIHIGNFDVLDRFIQSNPNCSYYIIDQHLNGPWFKMSWSCKFIGTNEDDSIVKALESLNMKFDKIIMNPPYSKNLHLKILAKAIEKLNENGTCVNLSPIRWLQDPLAKYKKNSDYKKFEDSVAKHIESLDVVKNKDTFSLFNCQNCQDLGIYIILKNNNQIYSYFTDIERSIFSKSFKKTKCIGDVLEYEKINGYRVRINPIAGGTHVGCGGKAHIVHWKYSWIFNDGYQDGKHWTTFSDCRNNHSRNVGDPFPCSIPFSSYEEAKNFENSTKTDFMHWLNVKCRLDVHFVDLLPWMGDCINPRTGKKGYESEWTDEDFYAYFGITEDEQKLIEETMEKYK